MTPHIEAKKGEIAKIVIMPGDPLRAKMIAETYLENAKLVTGVRGILGFTGIYKGKEITVMASGMGCASIGIYSYELYHDYDVDIIIRIGSVGAYTKDLNLYDVVLTENTYSDSSFAKVQDGTIENILYPNQELNEKIKKTAFKIGIPITTGTIYCSDVFYSDTVDYRKMFQNYHCIGVEMESFALFHNANHLNKKAACILTVSNNFETNEETTSEERQKAFFTMIELALETTLNL